jgi:hypothetical protein
VTAGEAKELTGDASDETFSICISIVSVSSAATRFLLCSVGPSLVLSFAVSFSFEVSGSEGTVPLAMRTFSFSFSLSSEGDAFCLLGT